MTGATRREIVAADRSGPRWFLSLSLDRIAAAFALGYVVLFACLLTLTTDGPDPTLPVAEEQARAASESAAMRASALLGFGATLAFAGFAVCLAIMLAKRDDLLGAALVAVAGGVTAAIDAVSAAGLVVAVEAADRDLSADTFAAFGDLHTAALLLELAPSASSWCSHGGSSSVGSCRGWDSSWVWAASSEPEP